MAMMGEGPKDFAVDGGKKLIKIIWRYSSDLNEFNHDFFRDLDSFLFYFIHSLKPTGILYAHGCLSYA